MFLKLTLATKKIIRININSLSSYVPTTKTPEYNTWITTTALESDSSFGVLETVEQIDNMLTSSYIFIKEHYDPTTTLRTDGEEVCCSTLNCEEKE